VALNLFEESVSKFCRVIKAHFAQLLLQLIILFPKLLASGERRIHVKKISEQHICQSFFMFIHHGSFHISLKRQCQPQCICLHFTLKVMECQQITIINISLVLCCYNSVKMSKYNHRMVEIYDGLKTKTWITLPIKWPPSIVWARNAL
jgi:hypothetical protein